MALRHAGCNYSKICENASCDIGIETTVRGYRMTRAYEDRLLRVVDYIHDNPAGDLSLDTLADVAAMSRFHWHRVFHAMTGETCAEAVRRIRLHRAACWLVQRDWPIPEVAERCGYDNLQSFSRIFRDGYGMTPGAFRKRGELRSPLLEPQRGDYPVYPIEIRDEPARRLAALEHRGPYLEIGKTFEKISTIFTTRNLWPNATGMAGLYYDDPTAVAEAELSSHAGVAVTDQMDIPDDLVEVQAPAGKMAVMHYKGPYAGLKAAYDHLYGVWLPQSGEEPRDGPAMEVYLNSPMDTAPEELLTDVAVPLK